MLRTFENKRGKGAVDEAFPSFEAYVVCFQKIHVTNSNIQQHFREKERLALLPMTGTGLRLQQVSCCIPRPVACSGRFQKGALLSPDAALCSLLSTLERHLSRRLT